MALWHGEGIINFGKRELRLCSCGGTQRRIFLLRSTKRLGHFADLQLLLFVEVGSDFGKPFGLDLADAAHVFLGCQGELCVYHKTRVLPKQRRVWVNFYSVRMLQRSETALAIQPCRLQTA